MQGSLTWRTDVPATVKTMWRSLATSRTQVRTYALYCVLLYCSVLYRTLSSTIIH